MQTHFSPGEIWPDQNGIHINAHGGGLLHHDNVWYWFGEHKIEGEAGNSAHVGVHCYRSTNLYDWVDAGVALTVSDDPSSPIRAGCTLERPKVIFRPKTGRFVMYFHLELLGMGYYKSALTGIAESLTPQGPYHFLKSYRPNKNIWPRDWSDSMRKPLDEKQQHALAARQFTGGPCDNFPDDLICRRDFASGQMARDMTLFVDDDGEAYHLYSSEENGTLHISRLSEDGLSEAGDYSRAMPGGFNEAPAVFKHRGKYYLLTSGCTGWAPNAARLFESSSIWGPWESLGNPCSGVNPNNGFGAEKTFGGQSTFVQKLPGREDAFIAMFDQWQPNNAIDGRYFWLPINLRGASPKIPWLDRWDLKWFSK